MDDTAHADPARLLELAESLAAEATVLLVEGRSRPGLVTDTKSSDTDLVTEIDRAAEALIRRRLAEQRPDDSIVGEEGEVLEGTSGVRWFVDPIDGTTNYVYGLAGYSVSIGVEANGVMVAGVVSVPAVAETFTAVAGRGAWCNSEPISAGTVSDPAGALVATGFAYDPQRRVAQAEVLTRVIGQVRDIRRMGVASVDLCAVAAGRVDAYYERGLQPWDHAAGALIASEAGARVATIDGGPLPTEVTEGPSPLLLAAGPDLWEPMAKLLVEAGAGSA